MVLKVIDHNGLEMWTQWSCKGLFLMGKHIFYCEGTFLTWFWTSGGSAGLVALYLACMTGLWSCGHIVDGVSVPSAVSDSLCRHGESAMISAGSQPSDTSASSVDWVPSVLSSTVLHSLSLGKGMDRLLQILTCGLPLRQLKAVSL